MNPVKKRIGYQQLLPVAPLLCLIFGFWPVLLNLIFQWSKIDNNYAYLVVPIFLYLCWDMRCKFRFDIFNWSFWGFIPAILALSLIILGELGSVQALTYTGIWMSLLGMILILYGLRTRHLIFPLIILLFIVPLPPFIARLLTFQLKLAASSLSVIMLRLTGTSVVQTGNIIDLGVTQLQVVDACSGLRYFVPLTLMSLLIGYFFTKGLWRRLLVLAVVLPLSVFFNALRIFISGKLTELGYPDLADKFFHDFSGIVIFLAAGAILVLLALALNRIAYIPGVQKTEDVAVNTQKPALPFIVTGLLCLLLICGAWVLRALPDAGRNPGRADFSQFPMRIDTWQGQRQYFPKEILDELGADDYVSASYAKQDAPDRIHVLISYYAYQTARHAAHAPQSCMLGSGWAMLHSAEHRFRTENNRSERIMINVWENSNARLLGSYFFLSRGRVITSPWMNKFYLVWDSITKRRTDGALVRAELVMAPGQSVEDAYSVLEEFLALLWPILPAYIPE